jgi:hypothetical protein
MKGMGRGWGHSYFDRNRVFDDGQSIERTNSFAIMALKATMMVRENTFGVLIASYDRRDLDVN